MITARVVRPGKRAFTMTGELTAWGLKRMGEAMHLSFGFNSPGESREGLEVTIEANDLAVLLKGWELTEYITPMQRPVFVRAKDLVPGDRIEAEWYAQSGKPPNVYKLTIRKVELPARPGAPHTVYFKERDGGPEWLCFSNFVHVRLLP